MKSSKSGKAGGGNSGGSRSSETANSPKKSNGGKRAPHGIGAACNSCVPVSPMMSTPGPPQHSPGGMMSSGGKARSPSGGGGRSVGRGEGGRTVAAAWGGGPGRDRSAGAAGMPSPVSPRAPVELGVQRQCQVRGARPDLWLSPLALNTDTCPMPAQGDTHCGHHGQGPQHLCANPVQTISSLHASVSPLCTLSLKVFLF